MRPKQLRIVEIFPRYTDIHRGKEVGLLLSNFIRHQNCLGEIWTLNKKELPKPPHHAKMMILRRPFFFHTIWRIIKNAKNIDVLFMVHSHPLNIPYTIAYKLRNPNGIAYVKADMDESILQLSKTTPKNIIRRIKIFWNLRVVDIFSVEQQRIASVLRARYPSQASKIIDSPNGYGDEIAITIPSFEKKSNIILVVGRLGSKQKATDTVLKVIERLKPDLKTWRVLLIGSIEPEFQEVIDSFYKRNPELKRNIIFTGPICNKERKKMLRLYARAKILFMPSRWEGFSNVPAEAAHHGCVIIGTPVGGVNELTAYGRIGELCAIDDVQSLTKALRRRILNESLLKKESTQSRKLCDQRFLWSKITEHLMNEFIRAYNKKSKNKG